MKSNNSFEQVELTVSDFVALINQTLEYAYPIVTVQGEVANCKVSRGKWLYFDLKDNIASVRFFGSIYQLNTPIENGMVVAVRGAPRLHAQYGFSVTALSIRPVGEGTIQRAAELLKDKLTKEGLFDAGRKRSLPYPPTRVGLITSRESAAYVDFVKVINARWRGITIEHIDVQVQGESAPEQIVAAIASFNQMPVPPEVLILTRGGGSAEDLYAFNTETLVRAVAGSRVPTLVAIGHEVDVSLAELAADKRASTPSNAAELLVPDRSIALGQLDDIVVQLQNLVSQLVESRLRDVAACQIELNEVLHRIIARDNEWLKAAQRLLDALNPREIMKRGYAVVRSSGKAVRTAGEVQSGMLLDIELFDGAIQALVNKEGESNE